MIIKAIIGIVAFLVLGPSSSSTMPKITESMAFCHSSSLIRPGASAPS